MMGRQHGARGPQTGKPQSYLSEAGSPLALAPGPGRAPRRYATAQVDFDIVLEESAARFARGSASARDLSASGVFLERVNLEPAALPLEPFYVRLRFGEPLPAAGRTTGGPALHGLSAIGRLTRIEADAAGTPYGLGIRFEEASVAFRRGLEAFLGG